MDRVAASAGFESRDSIQDVWGPRTPHDGEWPVRVDQAGMEQPDRWVQSCCILCSNGCGVDIGVKDGRMVAIRGRADDRVSKGRLGPKGLHGWVANRSADRLTRPMIRRDGRLEPVSWDEAMDLVVSRSKEYWRHYGSSSIAFYTSGQLFLEEYYTLAVIGKAGLGTPHMDGNTRLCTATATMALMESFGSDGQPGGYVDFDLADCIFMVGHNPSNTQTVLWMRVLDRLAGPRPPTLVVMDPRRTQTAERADVHLAPRIGTNVAVLNGLIRLLIQRQYVDHEFIGQHTVGFDVLEQTVQPYTASRVSEIAGVAERDLEAAADAIGASKALVSTVLQGVYQSHQATAAACQVNNIHLVRGMIGKPGCTVFQMNGQPTAQNTRETGCNGELTGFRNWDNPAHIRDLAEIWNVHPSVIPHWAPPTHAMQIFRYCEQGSIRMLWVQATNPAISLPELHRIRRALAANTLFLVVQDAFMTETAEYADVVLPAAIWGEKTGTFTNTDRTVHISHKAVEPPGEARSDLDIFLDYARRMDLRDKDGQPLIKWTDAERAFEAFKQCTRGKPCDYTGITYEKLSANSGVQWPCNEAHPDGKERLYEDGVFPTDPEQCEIFGHDLLTGAEALPEEYKAMNPAGRAIIKAADFQPLPEEPDDEYPFMLTTGRVVHHWHTRTKTDRSLELHAAAPDVYAEISSQDAERMEIGEDDWIEIKSRRGVIHARARIGGGRPGSLFVPFHYGYFDEPEHLRAANELTLTEWDPVSKQPYFKFAAVSIRKVSEAEALDPHVAAGRLPDEQKLTDRAKEQVARLKAKISAKSATVETPVGTAKRAMQLGNYIALTQASETAFIKAFRQVRRKHSLEPDIIEHFQQFERWSKELLDEFKSLRRRYPEPAGGEAVRQGARFNGPRAGGLGLLRDLHDLWLLAQEAEICWMAVLQAAQALRDSDLEGLAWRAKSQTHREISWLRTRIQQSAPQVLTVPVG